MSHLLLHLDAQFDNQSTPAAQQKQESGKNNINLTTKEPANPCYSSIQSAEKIQHLYPIQFTRPVRPKPFSSHCNQDAILSEESSMASSSSSSSSSSSEIAATSFSSSITFTNHNEGSIDCGVKLSHPCSTISKHATSQISATGFSPLIVDLTSAQKQGIDITFNSIEKCKSIQNSYLNSKNLVETSSNIQEEKCQNEVELPALNPLFTEENNLPRAIHSINKQHSTETIHGTFKSHQQATTASVTTAQPPKIKKSNPFCEFVSKQRGILESKLQTLFTATTTTTTSSSIGATTTQSISSGSSAAAAVTFSRFLLAGNKSHEKQQQQVSSTASTQLKLNKQQHPIMLGGKKNQGHTQQSSQSIVRPFVTNERMNKQQPLMKLKGLSLPPNEKQQIQPQTRIQPVRAWEDLANEQNEDNHHHLRYFEQQTVNKRPATSHSRITAFSLNDSVDSSESQKQCSGSCSEKNPRIDSFLTLGSSPSQTLSQSTILTSLPAGHFHSSSHSSINANNNTNNNGNINIINTHSTAIPLIYLYSNPCVQSPKTTVKELVIPNNSVVSALPQVAELVKTTPMNTPLEQLEFAKQIEQQNIFKQGKSELAELNRSPSQSNNNSYSAQENELLQTQKKGKSRDSVAYMLTRTNSLAKGDTCLTTSSIAPVTQSIEQLNNFDAAIPKKQQQQQSLPQSNLGMKKRNNQQQPFNTWNSLIAKKHLEAIIEKNNRVPAQKNSQQSVVVVVPQPNPSGQSSDSQTNIFAPFNLNKRIQLSTTIKASLPAEGTQPFIKNAKKIVQMQKPYVSALDKPDFSKVINKLYKNFATKGKVLNQ